MARNESYLIWDRAREDGGGSVTPDGKYFFFNTVNLGETFSSSQANVYWVDAQIIETLRDKAK